MMILVPIVLDISTSLRIIPSRLSHVRISTKLRSIFKISIGYSSNRSRLDILHICHHHCLQKAARHLPTSFQITAFEKDAKLIQSRIDRSVGFPPFVAVYPIHEVPGAIAPQSDHQDQHSERAWSSTGATGQSGGTFSSAPRDCGEVCIK